MAKFEMRLSDSPAEEDHMDGFQKDPDFQYEEDVLVAKRIVLQLPYGIFNRGSMAKIHHLAQFLVKSDRSGRAERACGNI